MQNIDIYSRRYLPRLATQEKSASSNTVTCGPRTPPPARSSRPYTDQFCVYNIPNQSSESIYYIATYIKKYKSPHKITLSHIYKGLKDIDIDKVVKQKEDKTPKVRFHHTITRLLVQPYNYIIRANTEIRVLSTSKANIYLQIREDPRTLLYHLFVLKGDIRDFTG